MLGCRSHPVNCVSFLRVAQFQALQKVCHCKRQRRCHPEPGASRARGPTYADSIAAVNGNAPSACSEGFPRSVRSALMFSGLRLSRTPVGVTSPPRCPKPQRFPDQPQLCPSERTAAAQPLLFSDTINLFSPHQQFQERHVHLKPARFQT